MNVSRLFVLRESRDESEDLVADRFARDSLARVRGKDLYSLLDMHTKDFEYLGQRSSEDHICPLAAQAVLPGLP